MNSTSKIFLDCVTVVFVQLHDLTCEVFHWLESIRKEFINQTGSVWVGAKDRDISALGPAYSSIGSFINRINHCPVDKSLTIKQTNCAIRWIEIYQVDGVIQEENIKYLDKYQWYT